MLPALRLDLHTYGTALNTFARTLRWVSMAWVCSAALSVAWAGCARPVEVPLSSTGHSVIADGERIGGIYPDLLQELATKERCQFVMTAVPRARLEKLFETGRADMLVATFRSERRDQFGVFIPMVRSRATLVSLGDTERAPFKTLQDVLDHKETRLVVVRGFDYGPVYQSLIDAMANEKRALLESDPLAVARFMKANPNDVTVMVPTILYGVMQEDPRLVEYVEQLRVEPLENIPWGESGVYLSKKSLEPGLMKTLQGVFQRAARSGAIYKGFASSYPTHILKDSTKPLDRKLP
jgi:polar amino acid transport system substrate-binding protein